MCLMSATDYSAARPGTHVTDSDRRPTWRPNRPRDWFGDIDIYLFDQILKERLRPDMRVLDAGCGGGRNLVFFLRAGYDVCGVDRSAEAIDQARTLAARVGAESERVDFRSEPVDRLSYADGEFDAVISSAVLHFADDEAHFGRMVGEMWRVLAAGGMFFARLASTIGIEGLVVPLGNRRFRLPDGTERLLVDEALILGTTERLGGTLLEPVKTVNVQNQRCMTTWVVRKA